jgi:hypothetical protein
LVANGDFEVLAMSGTPPMPTRDAFGNAVPIDWFRAAGPASSETTPLTELIGPENGDPPDDSDGTGQYSAAMNSASINAHSDWRSEAFETVPGEELFWSFDFKFLNYMSTPDLTIPEGFRIELRSFDNRTAGGSTSGTFAGEQTVYVYVHGYGPDVDGDGIGDSGGWATGGSAPHPDNVVTVANFNDGQWHTLSSNIFGDQNTLDDNNLWRIPSADINVTDGLFSDVRVSINAFNTVFTDQMQLRVDNISVVRPIEGPLGDYNDNGTVDAADFVAWRENLNQSVTLPNDETPGTVSQADYTVWRAHFGQSESLPAAAMQTTSAVPEPAGWVLCLAAGPLAVRTRRKRYCN